MNRRTILNVSLIATFGLALLPGNAMAQQKTLKEQLIGTWTLVSETDVYQDGRKENSFGPALKGAVSFDANGKVTFMIIGADLPTRSDTPAVSSRMVVAYFGTYSVDEAAKTVTYTAERATEPRFDGLARKASVTVNGDELVQASASISTPQGTFTPNLVFKRAK